MRRFRRREAIKFMAAGTAGAAVSSIGTPGCATPPARTQSDDGRARDNAKDNAMSTSSETEQQAHEGPVTNPVTNVVTLGFPWQTRDPFLFCVHHDDRYPLGNEKMGPKASLDGRQIGMDFEGKDGWRMYHGEIVPGFPAHPHRGFETVTVVRNGLLDHSDSMGAAARYGGGDVQWLTAGRGIQHSEMFPLLHADRANPVELFQIWLNLPAADKMAVPHFSMLWGTDVPKHQVRDAQGLITELTTVAGAYAERTPPSPPPSSWASRADSDVAIWTLKLPASASFTLPRTRAGVDRSLYFFQGGELRIAGRSVPRAHRIDLADEIEVRIDNGAEASELLLLQARPIGETVARHGPFVMNTPEEIHKAYADYRQTHFGGWPWPSQEPVHPRDEGRFARYADGKLDRPT
jgi:redox-sensitive bicupin YhaK (pirin superfamily)